MINNDVFRRIRYIFDFSNVRLKEIFSLVGISIGSPKIEGWQRRDDDENILIMDDRSMATFLNGLIVLHRGKQEGRQITHESELDNNLILRKIKIALNLRDDDMVAIYKKAGIDISKHEINAFFRKPSQRQYRPCQDQFLRSFFKGLQVKYRGR